MITPLPEILKAEQDKRNAMNKHYNICFLCGFAEVSYDLVTEPVEHGRYFCQECSKIKLENPLIFQRMLVIHAYAWEKGLRAAARY